MVSQTSPTERSVISTPTTSLASTNWSFVLPSITPGNHNATFIVIQSSGFVTAGSSSSQATFSSSDAAPIDPTTASDHHASTSATAEPDISSIFPLLGHNSEDVESTYTTTFTSSKTFFELTTMTTASPPTTLTTSTPYLTSTELITSTVLFSVTSIARSTFRYVLL
ncbi:hypothetical protein IW262DRAFT_395497 [Armillaria fumosa]|nr:hypothetical protein IW262DRAFT_395497 [Armillaria fumosa]